MSDDTTKDETATPPPTESAPQPDEAASAPDTPEESYKSRILIKPNGEVIIENLSMDLMELALALDPDNDVACDIGELLSGAARKVETKAEEE